MSHGRCFGLPKILALSAAFCALSPIAAVAGPPYQTDDPEPTPYRNFEINFASDFARGSQGTGGTLPHLEINYGALPNIQITTNLPLAEAQAPHGAAQFGYGDMEFSAKVRFVRETDSLPEISFAPAVDLPTGDAAKGLGGGYQRMFFPLWAQKDYGRYTFFGGGGLWKNPGAGNKNYVFSGLAVERDMGRGLSLGTEIYGQSADTVGGRSSFGFNVGTVKDLDAHRSILFSVGRGLRGSCSFTGYAGVQLHLGPPGKAEAATDQ